MNVLARKLSTHLLFSSPRRLIYLRPITVLQQFNSYATRTPRTKVQIPKPQIQKSSESPPILVKNQPEAHTAVWPKPIEVPFQAKVANLVKLIGYVKIPVKFESDSDGNHFAATVISIGGGKKPLLIPVVFEGDLAHIVACHVKENDSVFVSGRLSIEPLRLVVSENAGKFHVVAENLNFVEGFQKWGLDKTVESVDSVEISSSKTLEKKRGFSKVVESVDDVVSSDQISKWGVNKRVDNDASSDQVSTAKTVDDRNVEFGSKSGVSVNRKKSVKETWDLWRDLVNNPQEWWDYRTHKANGSVKEKFPDFKQKESGEPLWANSAPKWVLPGLGRLECDVKDLNSRQGQVREFKAGGNDVKDIKPKQGQVGEFKSGGIEDLWRNLVENPDKWWDNRVNKRNPKAPDFKHKETGEGLWLGKSPGWALSKLPPVKGAATYA